MSNTANKQKCISAADAYDIYHVTRAWLRENADAGLIRRTSIVAMSRALGRKCVKNLYFVEDIERELARWATRSQAQRNAGLASAGRGEQ